MRPEDELLLLCARVRMTEEERERARAILARCTDWFYLGRAAERHGLLPLLYIHMKDLGRMERESALPIPPDFIADWCRRFTENAKHNLFFTAELVQLLALFAERNVPCLAFKGPVQAELLYGNIALREFVDLDLLVREVDVPLVAALLAERGYAPQVPLTARQEEFLLRTHCERNFVRADGRCFVDLHWAFTDEQFPFALKTEELLRRLEPAMLGVASIRTMGREDLLLLLSLHAAKDLFTRLESLCAVAEIVRLGDKVDWDLALERAAAGHCERRFLLAVALAQELLDAPLPERVLKRVREERALQPLVREVRARLFRLEHREIGAFERSRWNFNILDRPRDAVSALLKSVFWPNFPDWELLALPDRLFFLYYIVRPLRLGGKYLQKSLPRKGSEDA